MRSPQKLPGSVPQLTGVPELAHRLEDRVLANGLRVVLLPQKSLPLVAVNLWYHVGSKNERPGRTGFAHLFEHMLFQGSQNVGTNEHFQRVQEVGGVANGSTWFDRTNYFETLPAHHLALGLWLESDRMGYLLPALDEEKLETQRRVVMNERRERVDNQPYGLAFERLHELLYPGDHPYHWPVIGYMDDISAASLEEVRDFYRTYYAPGNAVLTLTGDFEIETAWDLVSAYFESLPMRPDKPAVTAAGEPLDREVRETLTDNVALTRIYQGYRVPGFGEPGWYAADLLAAALSHGRSSPLYEELVHQRQLAQDVGVFVLPMEDESTLCVTSTVRPGEDPAAVEEVIDRHLELAARGELSTHEIERARNQKLTAFYGGLQSLSRLADLLSQLATFRGDPRTVDEEMRRYLEIEGIELAAVAAQHLTPGRRAVVTVEPAADSR